MSELTSTHSGGAELFLAEEDAFEGRDMYGEFGARGYNVVFNKTALASAPNDTKTLGIFSSEFPWLSPETKLIVLSSVQHGEMA